MLFHVVITSLDPCTCKGTKDTDIKRLELVGCVGGKREEHDVVFFCKPKDLVPLMGSMAIVNKENRFIG
jgi:hypothetical protein